MGKEVQEIISVVFQIGMIACFVLLLYSFDKIVRKKQK